MTFCFSARARVEQADTVAGVLAAADDAFGQMLAAVDRYEDSGAPFFAALVLAAAVAADGRDAVVSAPSMPSPTAAWPEDSLPSDLWGAGEVLAAALADLGTVLAGRLSVVGASAAVAGDRAACLEAARYVREICSLVGRR